jgi:hypothetical protein
MLLTLKRFGFNDSFVNWVKTMYTDIQTCVINNGWISEMFRNTRGIRQGFSFNANGISDLELKNNVVASAN